MPGKAARRRRRTRGLATAVAVFISAGISTTGAAQTAEPIRYTVRFPAPQTNYLEVVASIPTDGRTSVELMMPVWTPGSYLVREYERNVEDVAATAGNTRLSVDKTRKNRWSVRTNGAPGITVTYRVYAHEMTVRSNWVEDDFAMVNGAPTFMTLAEDRPRPHDVRLELARGWSASVTGLPDSPEGGPNHYRAPDYDTLVDCPIIAGNPAIHSFSVDGKPHMLVDVGEAGVFDGARAARDLQKLVETDSKFWGGLPYDKYVFFNVLAEAGGALEHKNSVMMMGSRWATGTRERYLAWLSTASHEFFHLWNVKRLRPVELGPFDYEHEVYTRSLWIAEGLTDYYEGVILARAGLMSQDEYLNSLSAAIGTLQRTPGRLAMPVERASFDAWIKEYRQDENSINTTISYYTKGAVIGFLLDARIRRATAGARTLDDVMRLAFQRYSGARGYTPAEFRRTASEVAGADLSNWLGRALDTTEDLEFGPALEWFGLQFRPPPPEDPNGPGWIGTVTRNDGGRLMVAVVPRGTPAYDAGVNAGDEIVAIGDFRVRPDDIETRLRAYRPGQRVSLLLARRDQMKRMDIVLGAPPADRWRLEVRRDAGVEQQQRLHAWLS